jgi:hypothetical protein
MRRALIGVIALCLSALGQSLSAQKPSTEVKVNIPTATSHEPFTEAQVTVNGKMQTTAPGGQALFQLAAKAGENVSVDIVLVRKKTKGATEVKRWGETVELNGSGHLEYDASLNGTGFFGQWPAVDFQGSEPLDVLVDGEVTGTTELIRGVRPDEKHTFEWKRGSSKVCQMQATLPVNVTRIYLCDAATNKVKEK